MYQIKIYNSIVELKKEDWDLLTEDNVYMCYEYLKTLEETIVFPLSHYYITLNDQEKLIGALVCCLERNNPSRIIEKVLLGRLHKNLLLKNFSFSPTIICNRQRGSGTHFIFNPGIKHDQIILYLSKMLDEMEHIAKENEASICFLNVTESEIELTGSLKARGYYKSIDLPSSFIYVKWLSFEGYKKYLLEKYPYMNKSIRHELNRNRKSGVVIKQLQNIDNCQERLIELLKMNHFKYNSTTFPLKPNFFQRAKENFGNNATIYAAVKDGIIIGVSVVLRKGEEAFFSNLAIDHELSKKDFTFFNLGYYEPIKNFTECNIKKIYFGRGLYKTKMKRGCITEDMFILYKPQNKIMSPIIKLWFAFHKKWMKYKVSAINKI